MCDGENPKFRLTKIYWCTAAIQFLWGVGTIPALKGYFPRATPAQEIWNCQLASYNKQQTVARF